MPASIMRGFARSVIASPGNPPRGLGVDLGEGKGATLCAGAWNSAVYEPLAAAAMGAGDAQCAKNRMSGAWDPEQPLRRHLAATGAKTLLLTGVNTDQCVLGTLVDAYNAGWDCVLVEDCVGTTTEYGREVCLFNVG
jgi:phosphatidylethanolamine-binding protein